MRSGGLRHRLTLQTVTETRGTAGGIVESWAVTAVVWGDVEPLSGREFQSADQQQGEVSHRITVRHRSGVVPKMRVLWGSRTFDIEAVLNVDERSRELRLLCRELL